jgi:uncharacterized protein (DUF58 family)
MRYGQAKQQKMAYAAELVATLAYSIVRQSDKVSLTTFDDRIRGFVAASNSAGQIIRITQHLEASQPVEKTELGHCLNDIASRLGRREIVMIFSDFFGDLSALEAAIQRMRYSRHEVVLFHILHHEELTFDFAGTVKFVGLEVPDELLANPDDLRRSYLAAFNQFREQLTELAFRNGCEYQLVDTSRHLADVLVDYLDHRSRIGRHVPQKKHV